MSELGRLEPDPIEHPSADLDSNADPNDLDAGPYLAHLATTLASSGGAAFSADLALDLVLNEIVEQARLASTAAAAAIALINGNELICRATTGASAPGLGVRLPMRSGLSGACVQLRQPQQCDDTELDSRVDANVYRSFEIRSIVMVPLLDQEQLLGIFEILSPRANEFGDREVQTLEALSRRIVANVRYAAESKTNATAPPEASIDISSDRVDVRESSNSFIEPIPAPASSKTDRFSSILLGLVVLVALVLGWTAGRVGWQMSHTSDSGSTSAPTAKPPAADGSLQAPHGDSSELSPSTEVSTSGKGTQTPPASGISNAGLTVYEKGKLIYRMDSNGDTRNSSSISFLPPEKVASLVIHRVEPEYPQVARNAGVQGRVLMSVVVNETGVVREVTVESGDPQLAPSAVEAVRQWRFRPYPSAETSEQFRARISMQFKLP
jgi:TonB family protein